ncbi:MAG TPA: hypothetical protein VHZ50_02775 [Puia sp.]|jgi:hypothetical protein|nr:hypothetical protein [Puia sp.]
MARTMMMMERDKKAMKTAGDVVKMGKKMEKHEMTEIKEAKGKHHNGMAKHHKSMAKHHEGIAKHHEGMAKQHEEMKHTKKMHHKKG